MKKCSILLSVYKPNKKFLIKQLKSLDNQTYKNLEVIIHDDCPEERCNIEIFSKYLKNVKYKVLPYLSKNLGYSKAFERLLKSVKHDGYISFCDQDDIWLPTKIEKMIDILEESNKQLAVCDRMVIDENDKITCNSVMKTSSSISENWNKNILDLRKVVFSSYALGMSIVCSVKFAKKCLPFNNIGHDRLLMCCAVAENTYIRVAQTLVKYRRHGNNVSGFLPSIKNKKDYYEIRVKNENNLVNYMLEKYPDYEYMNDIVQYSKARNNRSIFKLYKYRKIGEKWAWFEILICFMPNFIFKIVLKILRKIYY